MTKRSNPAGSGRGWGGGSERSIQSRSTPSEAKPGSLWSYGPAPSTAATPRSATGHLIVHQGITTLFSTSRYTFLLTFKPTSKIWGGMMYPSLETTPKTITVAGNFVFITLGTSLLFEAIQIEGAGNGPFCHNLDRLKAWVVQRRISDLARWTLCPFRHDRRLLSLLAFVHNWPTSRWSATTTTTTTKKENRFSLNGNGIISSFLGRQFYRSSLYY